MPTTRGVPEPIKDRIATAERVTRSVVAGHEQGAVRRILLYVGVFTCLGLSYYVPVFVVPALVCAVLLLATDAGL